MTSLKKKATTEGMTPEQRPTLRICENPCFLNQLAWVPVASRDKALKHLTFTTGGAANLDACPGNRISCKFVREHLEQEKELWVLRSSSEIRYLCLNRIALNLGLLKSWSPDCGVRAYKFHTGSMLNRDLQRTKAVKRAEPKSWQRLVHPK